MMLKKRIVSGVLAILMLNAAGFRESIRLKAAINPENIDTVFYNVD